MYSNLTTFQNRVI